MSANYEKMWGELSRQIQVVINDDDEDEHAIIALRCVQLVMMYLEEKYHV